MKTFTDEKLKEIGLLAVRYIHAYQDQQKYRLVNPISSLSILMKYVKPTNQAHSDLEMAVMSGGQNA